VLSQAFITALFQVCLFAIAIAATARYFPGWKRYGPAAALALLYAAGRAQSPLQFVYFSVTAAAGILVIEALVRLCAADLLTFGVPCSGYTDRPRCDVVGTPARSCDGTAACGEKGSAADSR
jgi:hypothetical protein